MAHFNTSQVISHGWKVFQENWKTVVPVALIGGLINSLMTYSTGGYENKVNSYLADGNFKEALNQATSQTSGGLLAMIVSAVVTLVMVRLALRLVDGEKVTFGQAFNGLTLPMVLWFILAQILMGLGVILGLILLIVPGVILALTWSQTVYGVAEGHKAIDAMKESARLTKGARVQILGFYFLVFLVAIGLLIVSGILGALTFGLGWLVGALIFAVGSMVLWLVSASIYRQLQATAGEVHPSEA